MEAGSKHRGYELNGDDWGKEDLEECLEQLQNAYTAVEKQMIEKTPPGQNFIRCLSRSSRPNTTPVRSYQGPLSRTPSAKSFRAYDASKRVDCLVIETRPGTRDGNGWSFPDVWQADCISNPDASAFYPGWEDTFAEVRGQLAPQAIVSARGDFHGIQGGTAIVDCIVCVGQQSRSNSACYSTITPQSPACTDNLSGIRGSIFRGDVGEDGAIDVFLDEYKRHHKMSHAVTTITAIWRGRKPRKNFCKYLELRKRACKRDQLRVFHPWIRYYRASNHRVGKMKRRAFLEWWDLTRTTTTYFSTLANLLERSFDGVTMPASQIYRLCTSRRVDTSFQSCIPSIARLLVNVLSSQYPWRLQRTVFSAWKERNAVKVRSRQSGAAVLKAMRKSDLRGRLKSAFRFWFQYTTFTISERDFLQPPIICSDLPQWHEWYFKHERGKILKEKIKVFHIVVRLPYFFSWWKRVVTRNKILRKAWTPVEEDRVAVLRAVAFRAFKDNAAEFRAVAKRLRDFLQRWKSLAKERVRMRKLQRAVNIMDTAFRKSTCFQSLHKYSVAQRMLKAAGTIQIWHRMSLATVHIHAWRGDVGRMWFVLCWRAWKSYAMKRLQWSIMMGNHLLTRSTTAQGLVFSAWRKVVERVKESPVILDGSQCDGGVTTDDTKVVAYLEEHHAVTPWRPPITRKDVMRPVVGGEQATYQDIQEAIEDLMSIRYCGGDEWILPRFWRHAPSEKALRLRSRRKGLIRLWLESDVADVWLWQKIVALKVSRSIGYEDPSHLVDAGSRKPLNYQKVRQRSVVRRRRGAIVIVDDDANMFEEVSRFHACLVHAEGFLETKAHSILGVGTESTDNMYQILVEQTNSTAKAVFKGDLLTSFIQPIVDHDLKYNAAVWTSTSLRDKRLSQVVDIHDLALAMQRHRGEFTLQQTFDPRANWQQIWETWDVNSDVSDTEEKEGFSSMEVSQPSRHQRTQTLFDFSRFEEDHPVERALNISPESKMASGTDSSGSGDRLSPVCTHNEEVQSIAHVPATSSGDLTTQSEHSNAESLYRTGSQGLRLDSCLRDQADPGVVPSSGILKKIDARHVNKRLRRSFSQPPNFEKSSHSGRLRKNQQRGAGEMQAPVNFNIVSAQTAPILSDASASTPSHNSDLTSDTVSSRETSITRERNQSHDHDHRELDRSALNKNIAISPQRRKTSVFKVEDPVYETTLPLRESPLRKSTDPGKEESLETRRSDSQSSAGVEGPSSGDRKQKHRKDSYRSGPRKDRRTLTVADARQVLSIPQLVSFGEKVTPNNQSERPWEMVEAQAHPSASGQGARLEPNEGKENLLLMRRKRCNLRSPVPSSNREVQERQTYSPDLFQSNFNIERGASFTEIVSRLQDTDLMKSQNDAEVLAEELARAIEAKRQGNHRRALSPERKANLHHQRLMGQLVGSLPRLDDLDDVVAQGIDPEKISGLRLGNCPKQFIPILGRIAVQPLATKFLFWRKVHELKNLRQKIAEDHMLAEQIKEAVWKSGAEFLLSTTRTSDPKHEARVVYGGLCVGRAPWMPNKFEKVTGIVDTPFPANFVEFGRTEERAAEFAPDVSLGDGEINSGNCIVDGIQHAGCLASHAGPREPNRTVEKRGTFHDLGWESFERCANRVDRNAACSASAHGEYAQIDTSNTCADMTQKQLGWVADTVEDLDRRREHTRTEDPMYHPPSPPKTPSPNKCSDAPKTVRRPAEALYFQSQQLSEPASGRRAIKPVLLGYPLANITPPNAPKHLDSRQSLHTVLGTPAGFSTRFHKTTDDTRKNIKKGSLVKPKRTVVFVGFEKSEVPSSPLPDSWSHDERDSMDPLKSYIASQNGDIDIADRMSVQSWEAESCPSARQFK